MRGGSSAERGRTGRRSASVTAAGAHLESIILDIERGLLFPTYTPIRLCMFCFVDVASGRYFPTTFTTAVEPGILSPSIGSKRPARQPARNFSDRALKSMRFSGRAKPWPSSG